MNWREGRTRSVCRKVMLTPEEAKEIDDLYHRVKAGKRYRSFSQFARDLMLTGRVVNVVVACEPARIRSEIRRIGVNINQIASLANTTGTITQEQIEEILTGYGAIEATLRGIDREYRRKLSEQGGE
ncbi:MobC family plasmid mobilization relaxosome protein [Bifidobacterium miconisargentati]|uniref:MobC family plasmid mobilization relaxosome protein n=1 Tax=Bifidobacterium miconisargentati TaxID=2834437 RepID=UPI001BDD707B|nr:MobC family plasmid mobilization relaxosome protein [Bifidobacterium miconisargentati]MBW3089205.1 plasmid mobilization relaxosome protein MobC [Bifidobacterium miconisargentati]